MGLTNFPNGLTSFGIPVMGSGYTPFINTNSTYWFVDGSNGLDGNAGTSPDSALKTIQRAVDLAVTGDVVIVFPKKISALATDPTDYAETVTIGTSQAGLSIIGVSHGPTQGGLPQLKIGSGSTAMITIKAPGCLIANMGINGAGSTGGGILLDDDGGTNFTAFGTTIVGCHFKNCKGSGAAATGGSIMWSSAGGPWQCLVQDNEFFDNRADLVLLGTSNASPKDIVVKGNRFFASANTNVDCNIYLAAGSGVNGLVVDSNVFGVVDVPAYATAPTAARYLDLTNCTNGVLSNNFFACDCNSASKKTFGAAGTAAKIPTTVRMPGNFGEAADTTAPYSLIFRT